MTKEFKEEETTNMTEYKKYQLNKEAKINFNNLPPEDKEEFKATHPFFRKNENGEIEYRIGIGFWEDGDKRIFLVSYNKIMDLVYGLSVLTGLSLVTYGIIRNNIIPLVKEYIRKN